MGYPQKGLYKGISLLYLEMRCVLLYKMMRRDSRRMGYFPFVDDDEHMGRMFGATVRRKFVRAQGIWFLRL